MTEVLEVSSVFDWSFRSVTERLMGIDLKKIEQIELPDWYSETIYSIGDFDSFIICEMEPAIYNDFLKRMNGGDFPDESDRILYMNEYMNIVCGQAVSKLNNTYGLRTRLSVPTFRDIGECVSVDCPEKQCDILSYQTEAGIMIVKILYTLESK